jgi:hypothetical protein
MVPIRGLTVCVGEPYARLLEITLWRNMRHLRECLVITTPGNERVQKIAESVPGVRLFETDDFTAHGARFNKGLAIEHGFDVLGRHGWILIWDCDVVFPETIPYASFREGFLHGCRRRLCPDLETWHPSMHWGQWRVVWDGGPVGFFQLFQAEDPALAKRPWYDVTFAHAGGGDAHFLTHWPPTQQCILPMEVLHLGPCDVHWFGTDEEGKKIMRAFVARNGWRQRATNIHCPEDANLVGEITERVQVPGFPESDFELPFVISARERKKSGE